MRHNGVNIWRETERVAHRAEVQQYNILSLAAAAHNLIAVSYILPGECVRQYQENARAHTDI
jgi:hypothetical protein